MFTVIVWDVSVRDFLEVMRGSALKAWVDIYMRDCGGIKVG